MKKEPTLSDIMAKLTGMDGRFDGMDKRFDGIDNRLDKLELRLDRVELAYINLDDKVDKLGGRVSHLEEQHERTFRRVDEFLVMTSRHEAELAALRCADARLDERLSAVEKKIAA